MTSRLVHPKLMQALERDFFPQRAALKPPVKTRNSAGEKVLTYPAARPGYEAISCRVGPADGGERRASQQTYLDATNRIVLSGQYPDLTEEWKVEVGGQLYDILLSSPDPEGAMTRLMVRLVR